MANGKKLVSYTGTEKNVVVPTAVGGTLIREIASDAFEGTDVLTVVVDTYANDINVSQLQDVQVVWNKEPKCAITFDANGGSGSMDSQIANIGIAFTLPECEFTAPSGKQFKNWLIGSTQVNAGAQYAFSGSTEVKANWENATPTETKILALAAGRSDNGTGGVLSTTGTSWLNINIGGTLQNWNACYGNGKFLVLAFNENSEEYEWKLSSDGVTWVQTLLPNNVLWKKACFANGRFIVVGVLSLAVYVTTSTDGTNWSDKVSIDTSTKFAASDDIYICYGNNKYVIACSKFSPTYTDSDLFIYHSNDCSTWNKVDLGTTTCWIGTCMFGVDKFVLIYNDTNSGQVAKYSTDAITWNTGVVPSEWQSYDDIKCICYGNGKFVAITKEDLYVLSSGDGINWSLSDPFDDLEFGWPAAIAYCGSLFIATCADSNNAVRSSDGITWSDDVNLPYIYYEEEIEEGEYEEYPVGYSVICSTN